MSLASELSVSLPYLHHGDDSGDADHDPENGQHGVRRVAAERGQCGGEHPAEASAAAPERSSAGRRRLMMERCGRVHACALLLE